MSNTPTMKSRYERLLSDASKHIPAVADETTDIPVFSLAFNDKGELLLGQLLDDSTYHFFIVKTYKTHVPSVTPTERTTTMSFATASLSSERQPPQSADKNKSQEGGYGALHFVLLACVMFLLVRLAQYLRSKGFE